MTKLHELFWSQGQSPWLDNIERGWITGGELREWVEGGVRGLTSNPTIFQKSIAGSTAYDSELRDAVADGLDATASYWRLVTSDITAAAGILRPVYDDSDAVDGYVSVEIDPGLARDSAGTEAAARWLGDRLSLPNLYVKIPATAEGLLPIRQMIAEKRCVNVTLIFGLDRYEEVIEAYLAGLEEARGDLSRVSSVASFFVSRVDTEVDRRLEALGTDAAMALRGKAAIANAKVAYARFCERFSGPRWDALADRGARPQRVLWASTSTKNPAYSDTLYVDELIGPDTVNTLPETTLTAFQDHGTVARTLDTGLDEALATFDDLSRVGVDLDQVTTQLTDEGVAAFEKSFGDLLAVLATRAEELS